MNTTFTFPHVTPTQPLREDPFWAWLDKTYGVMSNLPKNTHYFDEIKTYLKSLSMGENQTVEIGGWTILHHCLETWLTQTPWFDPKPFSELFHGEGQYTLIGVHKSVSMNSRKVKISPMLKDMVEESGWVYGVAPKTTYFEIWDGRLTAHYQQILGSRIICEVLP